MARNKTSKNNGVDGPVMVWGVYQIVMARVRDFVGYLVAPSGDPNAPACIVYPIDADSGSEKREALDAAKAVAADLSRIDSLGFRGMDFRDRPLPPWLWSLQAVPVSRPNAKPVALDPFDVRMLAALIDRYLTMNGRPLSEARIVGALMLDEQGGTTSDLQDVQLPRLPVTHFGKGAA